MAWLPHGQGQKRSMISYRIWSIHKVQNNRANLQKKLDVSFGVFFSQYKGWLIFFQLICLIPLYFWDSFLGQHNVTRYCWNSIGPSRWRVLQSLPRRIKLSSEREELHFPAGGQLVCMLNFLMNGVITLSVSCILDHPAPSWRCLGMRIMAPLLSSPKQRFCNATHWRPVSGLSNFLPERVALLEHGNVLWTLKEYPAHWRHPVRV